MRKSLTRAGQSSCPAIIDCHSHIAVDGSVNEGSVSVSSIVNIADVLNPMTSTFFRDLAGGVTVANVLHGSANAIGGQTIVIKLRWASPPQSSRSKALCRHQVASAENPKRSNSRGQSCAYPITRMGVEGTIRGALPKHATTKQPGTCTTSAPRPGEKNSFPPRVSDLSAGVGTGHRSVFGHGVSVFHRTARSRDRVLPCDDRRVGRAECLSFNEHCRERVPVIDTTRTAKGTKRARTRIAPRRRGIAAAVVAPDVLGTSRATHCTRQISPSPYPTRGSIQMKCSYLSHRIAPTCRSMGDHIDPLALTESLRSRVFEPQYRCRPPRKEILLACRGALVVQVPGCFVVACFGKGAANRFLHAHARDRIAHSSAAAVGTLGFSPSANLMPGRSAFEREL